MLQRVLASPAITAFNGTALSLARRSIAALRRKDLKAVEVLAACNNSTDDTCDTVAGDIRTGFHSSTSWNPPGLV